MRQEKPVSAATQRISVVAAGFGQNMTLTVVTTFLLVYLIEYARISSQGMITVTAIMAIAKVWDAINDPFMGSIVDMTRTRWGKLRPYILFSALPVGLISALLFCIPDISERGKLIFFGVLYILWDVAYTACDVPYWGLIGSAFPDNRERTRVISLVRGVGAIALGLATLGTPWLAKAFSFGAETTAAGWSRAVIAISAVGMALFLLAFFNTRERVQAVEEQVSLRILFSTFVRNKPLLMVLLGSILGFGRNIIQAGGAVFAVIAYSEEGYFTLIGAAIIVGLVLASFLTPQLLKRMSGKTLILVSSVAGAVFYLIMYFTGYADIWVMMALIFLTGLTLGIFMVVQTTMIADAVDDAERRTGVRNDGVSFSSLTFVSKLMGSLAVMVFGVFLAMSGYEEGVAVTETMRQTVFVAITLVPAASCLISAVPFALYRLDGTDGLESQV